MKCKKQKTKVPLRFDKLNTEDKVLVQASKQEEKKVHPVSDLKIGVRVEVMCRFVGMVYLIRKGVVFTETGSSCIRS